MLLTIGIILMIVGLVYGDERAVNAGMILMAIEALISIVVIIGVCVLIAIHAGQ